MKNNILNISILLLGLFIVSCEDPIDVTLNEVEPELVVEAWVDNRNTSQTITLTKSQPYFQAQFPTGVLGGAISLTRDDGQIFDFIEADNGDYIWTPVGSETLGDVGNTFTLNMTVEGASYIATSEINRVPVIDSIHQEFRENELVFADGIYAELYATDFVGIGDTYHARTYKNGEFLNKPAEMMISYDGTFGAGSGIDGLVFIRPIREYINRLPDSEEPDDIDVPPYEVGDSIFVELFSITNEAFFYLQIAQEQMLNGDNGIFTIPLANTKGNVINTSTGKTILGFFNTGAVETASKVIE